MIRAIILSAILASPASADMLGSFVFHAPIQGADTWSTSLAREAGAREANPFLQGSTLQMVAVKVPVTVGLAWLDDRIGRKSKRNQWIYRGAFVVGYALVVRHNLRIGKDK